MFVSIISSGLNITVYADKCSALTARLDGAISDFIELLMKGADFIPVLGKFLLNPILETLRKILVDVQTTIAEAVGLLGSILYGLYQLFVPARYEEGAQTTTCADAILRILGIITVPGDCGGGVDKCKGAYVWLKFLFGAITTFVVSWIPFGIGFLFKGLLDSTFNTALTAVRDILSVGVAAVTAPFKLLFDGAKAIGLGWLTYVFEMAVDSIEYVARCIVLSQNPVQEAPIAELVSFVSRGRPQS